MTLHGGGNNGWYVVKGTMTISQRITVSGSVNLILADGCNLTVNGGIQVEDTNSLTIYGQKDGTGKLYSSSKDSPNINVNIDAGIGGNGNRNGNGGSGGTIIINGGVVNASGLTGAGIGGGYGSNENNSGGNGGTIIINGGVVNATSLQGAGIGGGKGNNYATGGNGGTVTITGGMVTATCTNYDSAGIGGGYGVGGSGSGGEVTITGGMVTATSTSGAGIGGGSGGGNGTFQTNNNGNAVIFANSISDQSGKEANAANPWSGVIFVGNEGKVYGSSVTPSESFEIPADKKLTIESGKSLTIPAGTTLSIKNGGTLVNNGKIYVDGTFTGTADNLYYPLSYTISPEIEASPIVGGIYEYNGKTYGKAGSDVTFRNLPSLSANQVYKLVATTGDGENTVVTKALEPSISMPFASTSIYLELITDHLIDLFCNGGTLNDENLKKVGGLYFLESKTAPLPTDITRSGYTFGGWYDNGSFTGEPLVNKKKDHQDYYAKWIVDEKPVLIGLEKGKNYCEDVIFTISDDENIQKVELNGDEMTVDQDGRYTIEQGTGKATLMFTDTENHTAVMTLTVYNGHDFGAWKSNGDDTHTRTCKNDGCGYSETKDCTGGEATCKSKATCEYCSKEYGNLDNSNHNLANTSAKAPTYYEAGHKEYWQCKDCKKYFSDADGKNEISDLDAWKAGEGKIDRLIPPKTDSVTSDKDGNVSVSIEKSISTKDGVTDAAITDSAAEAIMSHLDSSESKSVVINASTVSISSKPAASGTSTEISISGDALKKLSEVDGIRITFVTDNGKIVLDGQALTAASKIEGENGTVTLVIETVEQTGSILKLELKLKASSGDVTDFGGGIAAVTVAISDELKDRNPVCVYIDEQRIYHMIGGKLNDDGTFTFVTGHFSNYAIMPEEQATSVIKEQTADTQREAIKKVKPSVSLTTKRLKKGIKVTVKVPASQKADKTGVIIYRSQKKSSGYAEYKRVKTTGSSYTVTNTKNIKGKRLIKGKKYYYKARAYKVIDGKTYYGPTSSIKYARAR